MGAATGATAGDLFFQQVAAGEWHKVAVKSDGTLWAWGSNGYGQLGDGTTAYSKPSPVQVGSAANWQAVAAGLGHTVALQRDGTLWAWGLNNFGQLGDGTTANKSSPVQVGSEANWQSVAAGKGHTAAVKRDGTLWAWGYNYSGQLGDGTTNNRSSPVQVGSATNWQSVAAGAYHTVAVKSDGTL
jgi:alpha-tubulin suppressor-like RCC1 family protein